MTLLPNWTDGHRILAAAAKNFGVDLKKIEADVRKQFADDLAKLTGKKTGPKAVEKKTTATAKPAKATRSQTSARRRTA
jgi:hypothetical protein